MCPPSFPSVQFSASMTRVAVVESTMFPSNPWARPYMAIHTCVNSHDGSPAKIHSIIYCLNHSHCVSLFTGRPELYLVVVIVPSGQLHPYLRYKIKYVTIACCLLLPIRSPSGPSEKCSYVWLIRFPRMDYDSPQYIYVYMYIIYIYIWQYYPLIINQPR